MITLISFRYSLLLILLSLIKESLLLIYLKNLLQTFYHQKILLVLSLFIKHYYFIQEHLFQFMKFDCWLAKYN